MNNNEGTWLVLSNKQREDIIHSIDKAVAEVGLSLVEQARLIGYPAQPVKQLDESLYFSLYIEFYYKWCGGMHTTLSSMDKTHGDRK